MAKLRITLDVDSSELFDRLSDLKGECGPLGSRLAGLLMTGGAGLADGIGLAWYGITVAKTEKVEA